MGPTAYGPGAAVGQQVAWEATGSQWFPARVGT